ncbi:cytochrome P450 [Saccharopolyspora sp. NPDC050389]|uniref:cytochrome P450 n=1 Tax=Saccharopolyspora sp. NPDC050389 TaxID=3155516 RepID=UPI0033CD40ED
MQLIASPPAAPVPLDKIDLYDPGRYQHGEQHASWHALRATAPVWAQQTPEGDRFWSVTTYRDVSRVLMDDRRFSSAHGTILAVARGDSAGGKTINLMDQPDHASVRLPTMRTMATRLVRERRERVRGHLRRILDGHLDHGEPVDFAELMLQLPMAGVGEIIGIPVRDWSSIVRWAMAGVAPADPEYATGSEEDTLRHAHHELMALFSDLIGQRRRQRRDDLISVLLDLDFGGRRMNEHEVLLNCYSFAMGAITTTPQVASHMVLAFADQPQVWRTLRANPDLVPSAVEEALRWASPTNHLMRRTLTEVQIGDVRLDEGELVCAWVGSANRDEQVFADPYSFDPGRTPNPHLAFGVGAHRCIGGPAAQVALAVLLEELIARCDRFELAGEVTHLYSNFINGITHLPVRVRTSDREVALP